MTAAAQITSTEGWIGHLGRGLAPRELAFVLDVAAGRTDKEIGKRFAIEPGTVKKRVGNAMFKLGVNRRAALVGEAIRRGLISPAAILAAVLAVHGAVSDDQFLRVRRGGGEKRVEVRVAARRVEQFQVAA
ncbi:LuxR C-terminal-related transcriptional regulator [Pseudomonas guariconensis]|uniref:response regulator transcription factor n=1 Tax=Pseudomonas guariconensis TaxID=1288410 RepID=UPI0025A96DE5|nr:LuxR C-terminal-related transcriptional regulator [Pseudomonas guariconensis]MDM9595341.1 LuxR C-terminal-related transcriptional regulator [Pseudomonas guariconensis]MDM9608171.1 LuxR C-terminal-related transcriptional regulator [Pseudomonas guariconensis]MDM9613128.1 LuxR C-terminal-related transcriptional regulator [Pseudomonas guariconensis]